MIEIKQNYVKDNIVRVKSLSSKYSEGVPNRFLGTIGTIVDMRGLWVIVSDGKTTYSVDKDDLELVIDLDAIKAFKDKIEREITSMGRQLNEVHAILNEVYGEEYVDRQGAVFVFKIPIVPITNGRINHVMTDFYTRLTFTPNASNTTYLLSAIAGNRGTVSFAEYVSNYGFSHLSNNFNWGSFCFGVKFTTPIKDLVTDLAVDGYNYDTFLMWCYSFKTYLGWESIEGVPYRHLNSITIPNNYKTTTKSVSEVQIDKLVAKFIESKFKPEFKLNVDYYGLVDNQEFQDAVNAIAPESLKIPYKPLTKEYITGLDLVKINKIIKDFNAPNSRTNDISFKGVATRCMIVDNLINPETDSSYLPTSILDRVAAKIDYEYNKWLKRKNLKKHEYYISKIY